MGISYNHNVGKELVQYIKYDNGERLFLQGVFVSFKHDVKSDKFYMGWSLKHKLDWAIYNEHGRIIDSIPFNKKLAINIAKGRAIKWAIGCRDDVPEVPIKIVEPFDQFIDRSMRYFKTPEYPEWIHSKMIKTEMSPF